MTIQKVKDYLQEYSYLKSIEALLHWDMETMMPSGAIEDRARRLSYLKGKLHQHMTSKRYGRLLEDLAHERLGRREKRLVKELLWDRELLKALPKRHVEELSLKSAKATHAWAAARKGNDWNGFLPHLKELVELKRRESRYFGTKLPYDALLRLHDKEFTGAQIATLFGELKEGLLSLKERVQKRGQFVQVRDLKGPFELKAQEDLSLFVARRLGLGEEVSRLDVSAHPFSINISPKDQRITTRYEEGHLDSLSSTMHEVGHALYEANLPADWEGTPFQEAISLSVHESQSRFWENVVGRSREFCQFLHPELLRRFPDAMKGIAPSELFLIMNKSVPSLIRVESCELYYNFHIIIRFELEELLFNEGLPVEELPELWRKKYRDYLDLEPKGHSDGVLQDSHWAGAAFGYFPTYALGNLISGSLWAQLRKERPNFQEDFVGGEFSEVLTWLREKVHVHGRGIAAKDIVGKLGVSDYLAYLEEKFNE